jgi:ribosomal protein L32
VAQTPRPLFNRQSAAIVVIANLSSLILVDHDYALFRLAMHGTNIMVVEVMSGLSAFSTMFGIAKSMKDMNDAVIRNKAVYDLTEQILAAQEKYATVVEQVRDLEKQITAFEDWENEKKRYQMKDFGGGTIAFALKPETANGEPAHSLCCKCYYNRKKGILQPRGQNAYQQQMVKCSECGTDFDLGHRVDPHAGRLNYSRRTNSDFDVFSGR